MSSRVAEKACTRIREQGPVRGWIPPSGKVFAERASAQSADICGGGPGARRSAAAWLCIVAIILFPVPASSAAGVRTLALADFAVRTPEHQGAGSSWLGPAVTELLQAKLQLFGGARVLERQRVRTLLREAKADAGAALDDPEALSGILPAAVLIAGSVSVDPQDPRRIRVQARAFEVETSKIVSEAAFSGTGDLAGLLKIAEDLAKTLADGLKLSYTPGQLAYAEPVKIDTLRFFVDGEEHLEAGRHREAIGVLQQALEGNAGRYYAAAHRVQGEAYRELAKASAGEQERAVREEYLRKFKEDALAASGALYDLGLAYEANGMWREALEAYGDYLSAIGGEGQTVRWRLRLAEDLGVPPEWNGVGSFHRLFLDQGRAHFFSPRQGRWLAVDLASGRVASEISLPWLFDEQLGPPRQVHARLQGVEQGRAFIAWQFVRPDNSVPPSARPFAFLPLSPLLLSALNMDGSVRWSLELDEEGRFENGWVSGGRIFCTMYGDRKDAPLRGYFLLTVDAADGRVLSRTRLLSRSGSQGPSLAELDLERAVLTLKDGMWDLLDGSRIPFRAGDAPEFAGSRVRRPLPGELPTGRQRVTFRRLPGEDQLLLDGVPFTSLEKCAVVQGHPTLPGDRPLLCRREKGGYTVFDPERGTTFTLYGDLSSSEPPPLLAANPEFLVFGYQMSPTRWEANPSYAMPLTEVGTVLNVFDAAAGTLLAKYPFRGFARELQVFILGRDLLVASDSEGSLTQVNLLPREGFATVPAAEAHHRRAVCSGNLGDEEGLQLSLARFEMEYPRDPRGDLLRMRSAVRRGDTEAAAALALRVFLSGLAEERDLRECLAAVRLRHPEVRDAIVTPFKSPLELASLAAPGVLVATPLGARHGRVHALVDVATGRTRVVETPEFAGTELAYEAGAVFAPYALGRGTGRIRRLDLLDGSRRDSDVFPFFANGERFVSGAGVAIEARTEIASGESPFALWFFDPDSLALTARLPFSAQQPRFTGGSVAVYVCRESKETMEGRDQVPVAVIDRETGREIGRCTLALKGERITGVAADRETLFVALDGRDSGKLLSGQPGALWMRLLALPLVASGSSWEFAAEGFMAGNPVLEGGMVAFPAWFGRLPAPSPVLQEPGIFRIGGLRRPLRRVFLDRRTGRRLGDEYLPGDEWEKGISRPANVDASGSRYTDLSGLFSPDSSRVIFPDRAESVPGWEDPGSYWLYAPDKPPARVIRTGKEREYKIIGQKPFPTYFLFSQGTIFESIGGGVILVKDFAEGKGMNRLGPP